MYTERQKETYHFFRATFTTIHCIKINNIWTQISFKYSLIRISEKHKIFSCQKGENAVKLRKVIFENRRNLLTERAPRRQLFRTFNSYLFNFSGGLRKRCTGFCLLRTPSLEASSFCDFWKMTSCEFIAFISSMIEVIFCLFRCAY